jgi:hypothetical protein
VKPSPDRHHDWRCPRCDWHYTSPTIPLSAVAHKCPDRLASAPLTPLVPVPAIDANPSSTSPTSPAVGQTGRTAAKAGRRDGATTANNPGGSAK